MKAKKFSNPLTMIEVIWSDCQLFTGGWEAHRNVMASRERVVQRSIGYVLADDKKGVVLAASLAQGGNVYGTVNIPASQIIKRRRLRRLR